MIDDTYGVAVVFDEEEDKDGQLDEVQVEMWEVLGSGRCANESEQVLTNMF